MPRKTISSIVLAAVTLLLAGGCGGSGGGSSNHNGGDLTGAYIGTAPVQTGYTGNMEFTVETGGAASGTLIVTANGQANASPLADIGGIPPGSYAIFGSLNSNGDLDLEGTASSTPFTITAHNVVAGSGSSAFIISIGGLEFQGTFEKNTNPSTTEADIAVTTPVASNAHPDHFPTGAVTSTFGVNGDSDVTVFLSDSAGRTINVTIPNTLQVGDTYTLSTAHAFVTYSEHLEGQFLPNTWLAASGSFTLTAKSGTHYSITLNNVTCPAVTSFGSGTGTVALTGTMHN